MVLTKKYESCRMGEPMFFRQSFAHNASVSKQFCCPCQVLGQPVYMPSTSKMVLLTTIDTFQNNESHSARSGQHAWPENGKSSHCLVDDPYPGIHQCDHLNGGNHNLAPGCHVSYMPAQNQRELWSASLSPVQESPRASLSRLCLRESAGVDGGCETCKTLRTIIKKTDRMIYSLRKKVQEKNAEIAEISKAAEEDVDQSNEAGSYEKELEFMSAEIKTVKLERDELANALDKKQRAFDSIQAEYTAASKRNMFQQERLMEKNARVQALESQIKDLKQSLRDEQQQNADMWSLLDLTQL